MSDQPKTEKTFFDKLKRGLFMTHTEIIEKVKESMTPDLPIDKSAIDGLEEGLLAADIGAELTTRLVDRMEERVRNERISSMERLTLVLREETRALIPALKPSSIDLAQAKPFVILVVGVNGTGKTTTIAKLASRWKNEGRSVILGAADTFRAAAIEQLQMWADRVGVPMVKHKAGSDPAAVAHDTVTAAKSRNADVVLIDTAGRLHNKSHLMQELSHDGFHIAGSAYVNPAKNVASIACRSSDVRTVSACCSARLCSFSSRTSGNAAASAAVVDSFA